jgi:hypothetical protein
MDNLGEELKCFAKAADITKEFLLGVSTRVSDLGRWGNKKALDKIRQVKELLGEATANRPPSPPSPPPTLRMSVMSAAACIDTPLGMVSIGGNATPLTANLLFTMIRDLQAKVDILTEQSKSTGVIFDRRAFLSETKFVIWFLSKNTSGKALLGFVDIISIWAYGTADHVNQTQWLTELDRSRKVGLKESMDVSYTHSMSTRYPTLFVGSAKDQILSTTTIKMFDSHDAWQGDGSGDGNKQRLTDTLAIAIRPHQVYCKDNYMDPEMKAMALRTTDTANTFWERLVAYIDDEYSLLASFKLLPKHILLLLSNQVVQICDDIFEFWRNASNVDISERGPAAAQFAWVSLQAQNCMVGYLKEKFRHHQALINSTFVQFLTRHIADQLAIGLKTSVDDLKKEVSELKGQNEDSPWWGMRRSKYCTRRSADSSTEGTSPPSQGNLNRPLNTLQFRRGMMTGE